MWIVRKHYHRFCKSNVVTDSSNGLPDGDLFVYCFISQFETLGKTIAIKSIAFLLLQVLPAVSVSPLFFQPSRYIPHTGSNSFTTHTEVFSAFSIKRITLIEIIDR